MRLGKDRGSQGRLGRSILVLAALLLANSCALTQTLTQTLTGTKSGPEVYYTVPTVTYVREFPGYASQHVATLYHGEQVTILSKMEDNWCRVQTSDGQRGWIQRALLSPVPLRVETYYVQATEVPLRPEPHKEVVSRQVLPRGTEVIKLAANEQGWWRVLVEKDKSLGWLPTESLADQPPPEKGPVVAGQPSEKETSETASSSQPAPKQFFVAVNSLKLHLLPLFSSEVVKVLQFNEKVEEVYQSGPKWRKVRYPETGVQGWTRASYLSESALKAPKPAAGRKKHAPAGKRGLQKKPLGPPEEPEPEVM
jgi:uncharacterized protein YgiM (DUF1202 family)